VENLFIAFKTIFPIFAFMAIGYILRRLGKIDDELVRKMNKPLFYLFIPIMVFRAIYLINLENSATKLLLYMFSYFIVASILSALIVPRLIKDNRKRSVALQGVLRSNFMMFAIPMAGALYGTDRMGNTALMLAICTPYFNVFGVWALEYYNDQRPDGKKIFIDVLTTPVVVATIIGFALLFLKIPLPDLAMGIVDDLSTAATPLALIMLGGSFTFGGLRANKKLLTWSCFVRLVGVPFVVTLIGVLIGFRRQDLLTCLALSGGPASVSVYTMTVQMGGDDVYAGQLVAVSSTFSVLTLFMGVYILQSLGLL